MSVASEGLRSTRTVGESMKGRGTCGQDASLGGPAAGDPTHSGDLGGLPTAAPVQSRVVAAISPTRQWGIANLVAICNDLHRWVNQRTRHSSTRPEQSGTTGASQILLLYYVRSVQLVLLSPPPEPRGSSARSPKPTVALVGQPSRQAQLGPDWTGSRSCPVATDMPCSTCTAVTPLVACELQSNALLHAAVCDVVMKAGEVATRLVEVATWPLSLPSRVLPDTPALASGVSMGKGPRKGNGQIGQRASKWSVLLGTRPCTLLQ